MGGTLLFTFIHQQITPFLSFAKIICLLLGREWDFLYIPAFPLVLKSNLK